MKCLVSRSALRSSAICLLPLIYRSIRTIARSLFTSDALYSTTVSSAAASLSASLVCTSTSSHAPCFLASVKIEAPLPGLVPAALWYLILQLRIGEMRTSHYRHPLHLTPLTHSAESFEGFRAPPYQHPYPRSYHCTSLLSGNWVVMSANARDSFIPVLHGAPKHFRNYPHSPTP